MVSIDRDVVVAVAAVELVSAVWVLFVASVVVSIVVMSVEAPVVVAVLSVVVVVVLFCASISWAKVAVLKFNSNKNACERNLVQFN